MHAVAHLARPHTLTALALLGIAATTGDAFGDERLPVEIRVWGPEAVRVLVAEGHTAPCNSADNRVLANDKFEPGTLIRTSTASCVCAQHTVPPFVDTDWTQGRIFCRPLSCAGRSCMPKRDPTIRIDVTSNRDG